MFPSTNINVKNNMRVSCIVVISIVSVVLFYFVIRAILEQMNIHKLVTTVQAKKKWDNLKKRYKASTFF